MISTKAVRTALYTKLNTASVTGYLGAGSASLVHAIAGPQSAAVYPIVIFNKQAGTPVDAFGAQVFKHHIWLVKAVVRDTSSSVAEDIDKAINDLLDFGTLTITGGSLLHMARESDVDYVENDGDQLFRHHGALYRVTVE